MMRMKEQELVMMMVYTFNVPIGVIIYLTLSNVWFCGPVCTNVWTNVDSFASLWWLFYSFGISLLNNIRDVIVLFVLCIVEAFRNIALSRRYAVLVETVIIYALSFDLIQALLYMLVSILALSLVLKLVKILGLEIKITSFETKYCVQNKSVMVLSRELIKLVIYYAGMVFLVALSWTEFLVLVLNLPVPSPILSSVLVSAITTIIIFVNLVKGCVVRPVEVFLAGLVPSGIIVVL